MSKRPDELARDMGLDFTSELSEDKRAVRIKFSFPDMNEKAPESIDGQPRELSGKIHEQRLKGEFTHVMALVTKWRKKVNAWVIDPPPRQDGHVYVAADLSFANRFRVSAVNKKNRKAVAKFWAPEALARRAALSQPTPQQGLYALKDQLLKYGITKPDAETEHLRMTLEKAVSVLAQPDDGELKIAGGWQ